MAINFSASFAACLAAGLKVPRQIMYCISQDTAPYVLYKDSQEATDRGGAISSTGQWGSDMYSSMQQSQQTHLTNNHHSSSQLSTQQQQHQGSSSPRNDQQTRNEQTHNTGNLPSPATSPYPQQQTNANQDMEDDVSTINPVNNTFFYSTQLFLLSRFCFYV